MRILYENVFPKSCSCFAELSRNLCLISGFRYEVDRNRPLLGYYAACIGNFVPTFRENLSAHLQGPRHFDP